MTYKYFPSGIGIVSKAPKDEYIDLFAQTLTEGFYNSSDWFTIEEETSLSSGTYRNVDVRLNRVIDAKTGDRVGDDFKKVLFSDLSHDMAMGWMYRFSDNYWITVNTDKINTLAPTITIRRCNNVLRWMSNGAYYEAPCILSYLIKENRDYATAGSSMVVPSGMIECIIQSNSVTNTIRPNQRFLFGNSQNWVAYRLEGGGISNFLNRETSNNNSAGIITLSLSADYVSPQTDDLVNGIANTVYDNDYSIYLNQSVITGSAGQTRTLQAVVKLGTEIVDRNLTWISSDTAKATVSASGVVTFVSNGTANITCHLENNSSIYAVCVATISSTPANTYQIVYSPEQNTILEGSNQTWNFSLYMNGSLLPDGFTFTLNPRTVPSSKYVFLVTGSNSFTVQNLGMYLNDYLTVTAVSGVNSTTFNIYLRGNW